MGFEPTERCRSLVFKTNALSRSAICPLKICNIFVCVLQAFTIYKIVNLKIITMLVYIDQLTKFLFSAFLKDIVEITSFLSIDITHNHALCWGLFQGSFVEKNIVAIRLCALLLTFVFFMFKPQKRFIISKILLQSGAICNFLDGLIYGYVVDLFAVSFYLRYAELVIFCINIADIYTAFGTIIFCYMYLSTRES